VLGSSGFWKHRYQVRALTRPKTKRASLTCGLSESLTIPGFGLAGAGWCKLCFLCASVSLLFMVPALYPVMLSEDGALFFLLYLIVKTATRAGSTNTIKLPRTPPMIAPMGVPAELWLAEATAVEVAATLSGESNRSLQQIMGRYFISESNALTSHLRG
jgi:hypothetical protein